MLGICLLSFDFYNHNYKSYLTNKRRNYSNIQLNRISVAIFFFIWESSTRSPAHSSHFYYRPNISMDEIVALVVLIRRIFPGKHFPSYQNIACSLINNPLNRHTGRPFSLVFFVFFVDLFISFSFYHKIGHFETRV